MVLSRKGQDVRSKIRGAYPRWIGRTRSFIFNDEHGNWQRVDMGSATRHTFLKTSASLADPMFSPDNRKLAFWDMAKLNIVVYDFDTKTLRQLGRNQANPLWLDNDTLAVTGVRTCNCEGLDYTGVSWTLSLTSGKTQQIRMTSTVEADVLS
jgi:hypothetical protein